MPSFFLARRVTDIVFALDNGIRNIEVRILRSSALMSGGIDKGC